MELPPAGHKSLGFIGSGGPQIERRLLNAKAPGTNLTVLGLAAALDFRWRLAEVLNARAVRRIGRKLIAGRKISRTVYNSSTDIAVAPDVLSLHNVCFATD